MKAWAIAHASSNQPLHAHLLLRLVLVLTASLVRGDAGGITFLKLKGEPLLI